MTNMVKTRMRWEKAVMSLKRKISRWLPNSYTLRRYYPEIVGRRYVPVRYRAAYMAALFKRKTG